MSEIFGELKSRALRQRAKCGVRSVEDLQTIDIWACTRDNIFFRITTDQS